MSQTNETADHERYTAEIEKGRWPLDAAVPLPTAFNNASGTIQNLLLKPLQSVAVITSRTGALRANHYHKTDWHYAYVVSGQVLYFERDVGSTAIPQPRAFGPGEMFFTRPMREHVMLFAEETVLITLAKNVRSHAEHEADLVRVQFITPELAREYVR